VLSDGRFAVLGGYTIVMNVDTPNNGAAVEVFMITPCFAIH
jgi:hypothetical protein